MANLKVFRFEPRRSRPWKSSLKRDDLSESADVHFRFALGKAYEDAGDYDRAWELLSTPATSGSARWCSTTRGLRGAPRSRSRKCSTASSSRSMPGQGFESDAPIFIVGLPRSGSTLIEQILASHSQVEGTLELPTLGRHRRFDRPLPARSQESTRKRSASCAAATFAPTGSSTSRRRAIYRIDRQAALHRQAAEQLLARRLRAPDPAEREDHQCAAPSARQPPRQLQAALRQGPELHLRHERARALLPAVPRDHEALAPRAARQGARRALRGDASATSRRRCGASSRTAACRSRRPACASTRRSARCGPRARSRCASRSTRARSAPGGATRSTSGRGRRSSRTSSRSCRSSVRNAGL